MSKKRFARIAEKSLNLIKARAEANGDKKTLATARLHEASLALT